MVIDPDVEIRKSGTETNLGLNQSGTLERREDDPGTEENFNLELWNDWKSDPGTERVTVTCSFVSSRVRHLIE
jgi:hypothetical protein